MDYNWSPYAIGGATRPDSFSRMTPEMQAGLWRLLQSADQSVGPGLQVYSGYRSPELQAALYQNALEKYGSPEAARKWVAPPGRSKHNTGQAADLKYNGKRIDQLPEDHPVRGWLMENAQDFGLAFPLAHEPWQVEVAGARSNPVPPTQGVIAADTSATAAPSLDIDAILADAAKDQRTEGLMGLAKMAAGLDQPIEHRQLQAPQVQPIQMTRRDTTTPYMQFFGGLNNGYR